jgi:hypothetical protein
MGIEEGFEIGFTEAELVALDCLEDVVRAVERKLGGDPAIAVRVDR